LAAGLIGAASKTDIFLTMMALAAALLIAAVVIKLVDRWRKRPDEDILSAKDQLAHFQQLHWRGELSKEEFERIQAHLGARIRQEQATDQPAAAPLPSEGTPQPPAPPS
jgi:cytochrome c-type biogenesis protein CcmH/NrfG